MSNDFVENVSGRSAAEATLGDPRQKSWAILLERKIKAVLVRNGRGVNTMRIQQPLNGQWLIVVNGDIIIHRPGKTVTSIYRSNIPVTPESIGNATFTNLVEANKPGARVKNETEMLRTMLIEVDRDLGLLTEEPALADPAKAKPEPTNNLAQELADKLSVPVEVLSAVADKLSVTVAAISKMDVIAQAAFVRVCNAAQEPKRKLGKSPHALARQAIVGAIEDDEAVPTPPKVKAGSKPEPQMFAPLLPQLERVEDFKRLDALLIEAIDTNGNSVTWATNVYVPVQELVGNNYQVIEHLHLATVIDLHSQSLAEANLAESSYGPLVIKIDADDMEGAIVANELEFFFREQRAANQIEVDGAGNGAFEQSAFGTPATCMTFLARMTAPIYRVTVRVQQSCKHPVSAVNSAISAVMLKTAYYGQVHD